MCQRTYNYTQCDICGVRKLMEKTPHDQKCPDTHVFLDCLDFKIEKFYHMETCDSCLRNPKRQKLGKTRV
ncbi:hypothetical protein X797_004795 [Metarhizium robertsii]|uniref:Uncharacterized protein n=1 Tax=Metarhizium robertsii TaxID=568076 RepID=A0A0A1UVL5_9HYPO|nr:hypothetical protein X797_004795 [Metarhizium robertsii]